MISSRDGTLPAANHRRRPAALVKFVEQLEYWRVARRFPGYRPQPVTMESIFAWLAQFNRADRRTLLRLLSTVIYYSEHETTKTLVQLNERLLRKLERLGVGPSKVIYVQIHDAGSSSPAILNLLRDAARLERIGCKFLDGRNTYGLHDATNEIGDGAIVYVDDFVATGNQFCEARDFAAEYIVGNSPNSSLCHVFARRQSINSGSEALRPLHIAFIPSKSAHCILRARSLMKQRNAV